MDSNALQKLITDAHSDILLDDAKHIIDVTREYAYRAINVAMVQRNWMLGKRAARSTPGCDMVPLQGTIAPLQGATLWNTCYPMLRWRSTHEPMISAIPKSCGQWVRAAHSAMMFRCIWILV